MSGCEATMKTWLVGSGVPLRTSCASCAARIELAAEGKTGEEIASELGVSAATLYNWRRAYGGHGYPTLTKELKDAARAERPLKRLLAEAELEK